ncbi:hypothetical protein EVAR_568_1 [Eumeta japonica]|uniref:Uncharacterized protein n=1 Tax=Eumeta variegata TaxID=151549 RepID=A0A4C1SDY6_EUMVA|nr:hypothetical protein EVAR_568_1 [Eumeta japonica]
MKQALNVRGKVLPHIVFLSQTLTPAHFENSPRLCRCSSTPRRRVPRRGGVAQLALMASECAAPSADDHRVSQNKDPSSAFANAEVPQEITPSPLQVINKMISEVWLSFVIVCGATIRARNYEP